MSHNHFGVKYPDGTWSGPISPTAKDLKPYAREHHGTIYEVGSAADPGRLCQRQGEPWVFEDYIQAVQRIDRPARYQGDDEADIAADQADIENDTRKCYPEFDLASKFGA
jgi:hypothetical protein